MSAPSLLDEMTKSRLSIGGAIVLGIACITGFVVLSINGAHDDATIFLFMIPVIQGLLGKPMLDSLDIIKKNTNGKSDAEIQRIANEAAKAVLSDNSVVIDPTQPDTKPR